MSIWQRLSAWEAHKVAEADRRELEKSLDSHLTVSHTESKRERG